MKKVSCIFISLLLGGITAFSQTIQYSRKTVKASYPDAIQLVANIGGYHHLLFFTANKVPVVYVFDAQLQSQEKKELPFKLKEDCDIRVIQFAGYYLLYIHAQGSSLHELWKINGDGDVTSLSPFLQKLTDSVLNSCTSTLQLVNGDEQLFIVAHAYYDAIKKMGSTVIGVDRNFTSQKTRKILYDFDRAEEILQQAVLSKNSLFLLKSARNNERGNSLEVVKADLDADTSISTLFNSGFHIYTSPAIAVTPKDSSVLVYSLLRESTNSGRLQFTVFLAKLDNFLKEEVPISLLKSQFRNNIVTNFLLLPGQPPCWLPMNNAVRLRRPGNGINGYRYEEDDLNGLSRRTRSPVSLQESNQDPAIRFTVLDKHFKVQKDSLIANNKNINDIQPRTFARFSMKDKAYLVLIQNFTAKSKGLVIMSVTDKGQMISTELPVYDRYDYLLSQLQAVGNSYFILPYTYKSEMGLVKIKME